ncbi:sensor histidine kinase [Nonomuraea dietziae]|uniref:sensor histidine kinase n=1 Tax=Nonomuraea dietziae TaxID=65515 RepID=UPI0033C6816E
MSSTAVAPRLSALLDLALAAVVLAVSLLLLAHGGPAPIRAGAHGLDLLGAVLAACSALPLVAWRRFPLGVFTVTAMAGVLLAGLGYPVELMLGPTAALYLLATSRGGESPWTIRTAAVVVGFFLAYLGATAFAQQAFPGVGLVHTGLPWAVAWFAGERTRLRREQVAELEQRALNAERDAERERLLAVAEERARIARDLHDSAGHAISLIAVRAGAARLRHDQDSTPALRAIEELARQTVEEIDQIVGTLREDGPVEPPVGLSSLETLIAHHTEAGLRVTLVAEGPPRPLNGTADQAAYRILQQALTNAASHGAGTARVELAFPDTAVEITVTNPVPEAPSVRSGGGHGLVGMRERATLLGGSFDTERVNGTFRVHVRIPYGGHRA